MKTMNGWRRGGMWGGEGSFGPSTFMSGSVAGTASLGQGGPIPQGDWQARGQAAIAAWDTLVARVANIKDEAERGKLLEWMGRSDTPGSNTERYKVVLQDLKAGSAADPALAERRVGQFEGAVRELTTLVENAEKIYGTIQGGPVPGVTSTPGEGLTMKGAAMLGVAVLSLLVVPFVLKD
jgi:hypothetical protein